MKILIPISLGAQMHLSKSCYFEPDMHKLLVSFAHIFSHVPVTGKACTKRNCPFEHVRPFFVCVELPRLSESSLLIKFP